MTAQISDVVIYREQEYDLAGVKGDGLFEPHHHGLSPQVRCTACWRGFWCRYRVDNDKLFLDRVALYSDDSCLELFGVKPRPPDDEPMGFDVEYRDLRAKLPYTGGLLLARGFIEALYVHMGHHPAWKYREVHELLFDDGNLIAAHDRSNQMETLRDRLSRDPLHPGAGVGRKAIEKWVEECFSLDYDF
jgi:hypothetical protein